MGYCCNSRPMALVDATSLAGVRKTCHYIVCSSEKRRSNFIYFKATDAKIAARDTDGQISILGVCESFTLLGASALRNEWINSLKVGWRQIWYDIDIRLGLGDPERQRSMESSRCSLHGQNAIKGYIRIFQ